MRGMSQNSAPNIFHKNTINNDDLVVTTNHPEESESSSSHLEDIASNNVLKVDIKNGINPYTTDKPPDFVFDRNYGLGKFERIDSYWGTVFYTFIVNEKEYIAESLDRTEDI